MEHRTWKAPNVKKSISFPPHQHRALAYAARDDGHGNISRLIQDLVEADLRSRYGRDWVKVIEA